MNLNLVSMSYMFTRVVSAVLPSRLLRAGLPCLVLTGCMTQAPESAINGKTTEKLPQHQVADFLSTDCNDIWSLYGKQVETNPLYWLRGMDCAERLAPAVARAQARSWPDDTWQDTFKRGILLASAKISPVERRQYMTRLDALSPQLPVQIRALFQVWRDGQTLQLQLAEERSRYSKLQQSADSELDTLRSQQQYLRDQLETTSRKLENLTDIERRMSTRKPVGSDLPEGGRQAAPDVKQEEAKP
ncbi:two-component system QseEF-associated lipoprotein QseG [Enterobacter sp.]|uniref:two-component system QseEF-associated lipoprotein QseG n=1 Tax=Enterobacter sp. TaxID=42895 RepID=UPI00296EFD83|nr:two-component system QseEF-associated lipoprotein QseG [Enterobacter sp.]